jgi:hypothetical protein
VKACTDFATKPDFLHYNRYALDVLDTKNVQIIEALIWKAILSTSALPVGPHSIITQYINNNFKPSLSSIFTLTVLNQLDTDPQPRQPENPVVNTKTATKLTSKATEYESG